jgi:hypothetical protein
MLQTARQSSSMVLAPICNRLSDREALLDYRLHDRLGVVVTSPLGGLGASLMIQLATTAYYDARPARRSEPSYADIYVFHVGGRQGDFSNFDLRPSRKEVFIPEQKDVLGTINAHAITHLVVPDAPVRSVNHVFKEPEAARDRIRHCFAYSPSGRAHNADIALNALDHRMVEDQLNCIDPTQTLSNIPAFLEFETTAEQRQDTADWADSFRQRLTEVSQEDRARAMTYREAISANGLPRETYRRISIDEALGMLSY